jgi:hypothetical protein
MGEFLEREPEAHSSQKALTVGHPGVGVRSGCRGLRRLLGLGGRRG